MLECGSTALAGISCGMLDGLVQGALRTWPATAGSSPLTCRVWWVMMVNGVTSQACQCSREPARSWCPTAPYQHMLLLIAPNSGLARVSSGPTGLGHAVLTAEEGASFSGSLCFLPGEEVALYCAKYLPGIIKDQKAYKEGKLQKVRVWAPECEMALLGPSPSPAPGALWGLPSPAPSS